MLSSSSGTLFLPEKNASAFFLAKKIPLEFSLVVKEKGSREPKKKADGLRPPKRGSVPDNPVKDDGLSSRRREFKRQLLSLQKKDAPGHLERKRYAFAALKRTKMFGAEKISPRALITKTMKIKLLLKRDLLAAHKMHQDYIGGQFYGFFKQEYKKQPELFVACYNGKKLVGVCWGSKSKHKIILNGIAVEAKYQKKGLGKKLLKYFEKQVKTIGIKTITVGAANSPTNVVGFYKKSGYKITKPHKQYTVMEKRTR